MFLISGPSLLYVFKKWSEFTLKVVRVYLKSGPSLPGPNLPGPNLLVFVTIVVVNDVNDIRPCIAVYAQTFIILYLNIYVTLQDNILYIAYMHMYIYEVYTSYIVVL